MNGMGFSGTIYDAPECNIYTLMAWVSQGQYMMPQSVQPLSILTGMYKLDQYWQDVQEPLAILVGCTTFIHVIRDLQPLSMLSGV